MGESKPSGISEIDALRATISIVEQQRENYRQDAKEARAQVSALQAEVERLQKVEGERDAARNALAEAGPFLDHLAGQEASLTRFDGSEALSIQACEALAAALGIEIGGTEWLRLVSTGKLPSLTETKEGSEHV